MTRVSNVAQQQALTRLMGQVNQQLFDTRAQVTTGRKANHFSGLSSSDALASINLRGQIRSLDSFIASIQVVQPRADTMDTILNDIATSARDVFQNNILHPRDTEPPMNIVRDQAQRALALVQAKLNTALDGRFLFSSQDVLNAPYADAAQLTTNTQTQITDWLAGTITGADVLTNMNAYVGADLGYSASLTALPGTARVTVQADTALTIDYTVRADDPGVADVLRGLSILSNLQYDAAQDAEFWEIFEGAQSLLESGAGLIDGTVAGLGLARAQMQETRALHEGNQVLLHRFIEDAENVQVEQAISRMQQLQTQLQVSYETISTLRDLSLVNFLR